MHSDLPHITRVDTPRTPRCVVLALHGGQPHSTAPVDGRSASWVRMALMQRAIGHELADADAATWLLRYRHRGWNGTGAGATEDARQALEEIRRALGDVPVVLLGHSMGGRVAVHVADDRSVQGVVALAPWWQPGDPVRTLQGRTLRAAHGRADRITSYAATAEYVDRARREGVDADLTDMGGLGHYMLAGSRRWSSTARDLVLEVLGKA